MTERISLKGLTRAQIKKNTDFVRSEILKICENDYMSASEVSETLGMSINTIRARYIYPMCMEGLLVRLKPQGKNYGQKYKKLNSK